MGVMPSKKVAGLYNRLIECAYADQVKIEAIAIELKAELNAAPQDVAAHVALLQSYCMQAKAEEALAQAEHIWKMGGQIAPFVERSYVSLLLDIGLYSWAESFVVKHVSERAGLGRVGMYPIALTTAVGLGDVDLLEQVMETQEGRAHADALYYLIDLLRQEKWAEEFKAEQQAVAGLVTGKQVAYEVVLNTTLAQPFFDIGIFIKGDSVDRYRLQSEIDRTIRDLRSAAGLVDNQALQTRVFDFMNHMQPKT